MGIDAKCRRTAPSLSGLGALAAGLLALSPAMAAPTTCAAGDIAALKVPNMTVMSAAVIAAADQQPEYCDVKGSILTDGDGAGENAAGFEIKLPTKWNGKFLFLGSGGLAGSFRPSVNRTDLLLSLAKGYATAMTDTGHTSASAFDTGWILVAPGQPSAAKIADFWYRAAHQVTVAAKRLVSKYYQAETIEHAYFDGCSNGGRMGLMEAMRYPDDYDGIIAGAPYLDNRTQIWGYKNAQAFRDAYIAPELIAKVDAAVTASCDAADGVKDGLIQNPARCGFDPDSLVPGTLTKVQSEALKLYLRAPTDDKGRVVFPGSSISDLGATGMLGGFIPWAEKGPAADPEGSEPWGKEPPLLWAAAEAFVKYFAMQDPTYNFNRDWPEKDGVVDAAALEAYDRKLAIGGVESPKRLSTYLGQDKKLILWHGYDDAAIPPFRTVWFYQDLAKELGGYDKAQDQVRLFMVPGMLHCAGGPGPNAFDTLSALEDWVERGTAPDAILATKYNDDKPADGVARTMPLCKFPERAHYKGGGVNDAASWSCPADDQSLLEIGPNGEQAAALRPEE